MSIKEIERELNKDISIDKRLRLFNQLIKLNNERSK